MTKDEIQAQALAALLPHYRAGAALGTGVGKTLVGLKHMVENYSDQSIFLIAAPKISIFQSWKDEAIKHNLEYLIDHMKFTTYLSLSNQNNNIDVLYLDECHSLKIGHALWLNTYGGKIVGLTGTPPKFKNSEKGQMVDKFCPIVFTYGVDDAIGDDLLNDYRIVVHMVDLSISKNIKMTKKDGGIWYSSEQAIYDYWSNRIEGSGGKQLQMMRIMRMSAMKKFKSKEYAARKVFDKITEKCLIFANTQEQAEILCNRSYHSKNPESKDNLELFKQGSITRLSAVEQLNEGINIPNLKHGIILHSYGNERKTPQKIGRFLRLNPDDTATVHMFCFRNTIDEQWITQALEGFDQTKIIWE